MVMSTVLASATSCEMVVRLFLVSEVFRHRQRLRIVHLVLIEPDQIELALVLVLDILIDGVNRARRRRGGARRGTGRRDRRRQPWYVFQRFLEHHQQSGAGVFGIEIDFVADERFLSDRGAAEIETALDLETGVLQQQGVHLADRDALGKVLRSDPNGRGVLSERAGNAQHGGSGQGRDGEGLNERCVE